MGSALAAGFGLGFLVAAQVGPIWLLCARSVLRGTFVVGVAIGAGAAAIDALYAALGALGASALLQIDPVRIGLGLVGAGVLAVLGLRTLCTRSVSVSAVRRRPRSPRRGAPSSRRSAPP